MSLSILFLDDDRSRAEDFAQNILHQSVFFQYISTVEHMINSLQMGSFDYLFLDHDLDLTDTQCGLDAAKRLADNVLRIHQDMKIIIHSQNPYGVANMMQVLKHLNNPVLVIPNVWTCVAYDHSNRRLTFGL